MFFLQNIVEIFDIFINIFPTKNFIKNLRHGFFSKEDWQYFATKIILIGKALEENKLLI